MKDVRWFCDFCGKEVDGRPGMRHCVNTINLTVEPPEETERPSANLLKQWTDVCDECRYKFIEGVNALIESMKSKEAR